jgi:hypothetical protein
MPDGREAYIQTGTAGLRLRVNGKNFAYVQDGSWIFQQVFSRNPGGSFAHIACWVASGPFAQEYLKAIGSGENGMRYSYRNESHLALKRVAFVDTSDQDYEGALGVEDNGGFMTGTPETPKAKAKLRDRPDTRYSEEDVQRIQAEEGAAPRRRRQGSSYDT